MLIPRPTYLSQLISHLHNGQIKIITGIRRCGKSFLLFELFYKYLLSQGIEQDQIIALSLDDDLYESYRDPHQLSCFVRSKITDPNRQYFLLIDEIQFAISRQELRNADEPVRLYSVLNGLLRLSNVDIYVTGSNSKMLTKDILTEFRGRGDPIAMHPLSFQEIHDCFGGERALLYEDFASYGGLPQVWNQPDEGAKTVFLQSLFQEVYYKDITERYGVTLPEILDELTDVLCSSVGSLTNANKISKTLKSIKGQNISSNTIATYLNYLTESFLFRCAKRFDVKGKRYFEYPLKFYCEDIGLRNAHLNLRQQEESHIMENIVFNELIHQGYAVDVGVIDILQSDSQGRHHQKRCVIDFVATKGPQRFYIQVALHAEEGNKKTQEERPLLALKDAFQRIIITKTMAHPWIDDHGIRHLGLYDFLLNT